MKSKENQNYEVKLYIGSREGYNGRRYTEEELIEALGEYQKSCEPEDSTPVRVTPTTFVHCDYHERGWEIVAIMYPRFPKPVDHINHFMEGMAQYLLTKFKQNRISVAFPDKIVMFESPTAEQKH